MSKPCCEKWELLEDEEVNAFKYCPWCGVRNRKVGEPKWEGRPVNMAMHEKRAMTPKPHSTENHTAYQLWLIACRKAGYDYIGVPVGGYARKIGEVKL